MKKMMVVRLILTAAILYGVYLETGVCTVIFAALTAGGLEILTFHVSLITAQSRTEGRTRNELRKQAERKIRDLERAGK